MEYWPPAAKPGNHTTARVLNPTSRPLRPRLANETKMAYPFVRMDPTKGFFVCRQGQNPATGPLHCQNLRRGERQSVRAAATPAESSGAPGGPPTPARTGEPVSWPARWSGVRSPQAYLAILNEGTEPIR